MVYIGVVNARETNLRNILAKQTCLDPATFQVSLVPLGGGSHKVVVQAARALTFTELLRIDSVLKPRWYWPLVLQPFPFILALTGFFTVAVVFKSWICLVWLFMAYHSTPRQCPMCRRYHV